MTISSTDDPRAGPFNGNGSQTVFPFVFKTFAKADLLVVRTDADGLEHVLMLDSDFSVSLNADQDTNPGGSVTYPISGDELPAGETLTIASDLDYIQTTDIQNAGGFFAQVVEDALDRNVMLVKQVNSKTDRALQLSVTTPDNVSVVLPAPVAQKIIGWDDTATGLVNRDITDFATAIAFANWQSQTFNGDGVTTVFALSSDPGNVNNMDVSISGVTQTPAVDFTLSGTTLTFTTAPTAGTGNILARYGRALPQGTAALEMMLADAATVSNGAALVGRGYQVVSSIAALRALLKTTPSQYAFVTGYYAQGDGGGGPYYLDAADTTTADNGGTVIVATDGARWKLAYTTNLSIKQFGAKGDDTGDQASFFAAAAATNATIHVPAGTYRFTTSAAIPNSCFARFIGVGNKPVQQSKIHVAFAGAAFTLAGGLTSFYGFENLYCYSEAGYAGAQFINALGDTVHAKLLNLTLYNFKGKAIDLATAFRCEIEFLGQYCWDYMLRISGGSASHVKFTADHSYAGGVDINGGGHVIEPYTEAICSDNNPAGANASHREMIIRGAQHTVVGGVLSLHAQNNKYPIEIAVGRAITFQGVRGFSLGAAPHWINIDATDSSVLAIDCPDFTYAGTTQNLMVLDAGYTTTKPEITISGQSVRNTTARVWCCFDGATGTNRQAQGITAVSRTGVGVYRITWPAGTFANANYVAQICAEKSGVVTAYRYTGKTTTQIDIQINNSASTAAVDADDVSVVLMGI